MPLAPNQYGAISAGRYILHPHLIEYIWIREDLSPPRVNVYFTSGIIVRLTDYEKEIVPFFTQLDEWYHTNQIRHRCHCEELAFAFE